LKDADLSVEPEPAGRDLASIRLLVKTTLSGRPPLEMLHRVRHVDRVTVDARLLERVVEYPPRRADKRLPGEILPVARLLADEDDLGRSTALAKYGLRRVLP
jgi:hypothetical protein